eukprot:GHVO01052556.1.p1 GENE.GHVO01052556.1~~GHVO01052556.1.p1  ORF type:complete len:126 (+),score=20.73 GHVO01052556.1:125-502(+)
MQAYEWHQAEISAIALTKNGSLIASADVRKNVYVTEVSTGNRLIDGQWTYHKTKITSMAWSPDGTKLASGSVDSNINVFDIDKPVQRVAVDGAHYGAITDITFIFNNVISSTSSDGTIALSEIWF